MSTPAELYKNAIDLNRFSNSVAKRVARTYNDLIEDTLDQLAAVGSRPSPTQAARLNSILIQLKSSLDGWADVATELTATELQGLTELQVNFIEGILQDIIPEELSYQVKSVQISPEFAKAVATIDPTTYNVVTLSDDLGFAVTGTPKPFTLDIGNGSLITLPNGANLSAAYKRLAGRQAEIYSREVRNGLITGESAETIAKRLRKQLTAVPNNQIRTMVRTSVNQIQNAASQAVYTQNSDVVSGYRYMAVLDTKTSAICRALDGRVFEFGDGPLPPQHFNCRSAHEAFIDYKKLGFSEPPGGERRAGKKFVPAGTNYGEWLYAQDASTKNDALGASKVPYFNYLARKYGATNAIARFVSDDGTELTLEQLRQKYPRVKAFK